MGSVTSGSVLSGSVSSGAVIVGVVVSSVAGRVSFVGAVASMVVDVLFEDLSSSPPSAMAPTTPTTATRAMDSQLHIGSPATLRFQPDDFGGTGGKCGGCDGG